MTFFGKPYSRVSIPQSPLATAPERGEKDFLDMVSLRILAKGSETAPFGAVRALLSKRAERLPYKIQQRFFDERQQMGAFK